MAFWNEMKTGSRFSLDDAARSADRSLNWVILFMLLAFAYALWPTAAWGPSLNRTINEAPNVTAPPVPHAEVTPTAPAPSSTSTP